PETLRCPHASFPGKRSMLLCASLLDSPLQPTSPAFSAMEQCPCYVRLSPESVNLANAHGDKPAQSLQQISKAGQHLCTSHKSLGDCPRENQKNTTRPSGSVSFQNKTG